MNPGDFPAGQAQPLTDEQWTKILGKRRVRFLFTAADQELWRQHSRLCLTCARISDVGGDPRRGFCLEHGFMTSNAFPVLCRKFVREGGKP